MLLVIQYHSFVEMQALSLEMLVGFFYCSCWRKLSADRETELATVRWNSPLIEFGRNRYEKPTHTAWVVASNSSSIAMKIVGGRLKKNFNCGFEGLFSLLSDSLVAVRFTCINRIAWWWANTSYYIYTYSVYLQSRPILFFFLSSTFLDGHDPSYRAMILYMWLSLIILRFHPLLPALLSLDSWEPLQKPLSDYTRWQLRLLSEPPFIYPYLCQRGYLLLYLLYNLFHFIRRENAA